MGVYGRIVTYERALRAGRNGATANAAVMAVTIELLAADWGFPPKPVWEGAQRRGLKAAQVMDLLDQYGMDAVRFLEVI